MNWYRVLDVLQVRPPGVAGRGIYFLSGQAITLDALDDLGTSGVGCPGCLMCPGFPSNLRATQEFAGERPVRKGGDGRPSIEGGGRMGRRPCIGNSPTSLPVGIDGAVINFLTQLNVSCRSQAVALTDRNRQITASPAGPGVPRRGAQLPPPCPKLRGD